MGNLKYIIDHHPAGDYVDGHNKIASPNAIVSCVDEDIDFPATNLYNKVPSKPLIINASASEIVFNFGESTECDCIGIIGHNIPLTAYVSLHSSTNSTFTNNLTIRTLDVTKNEIYRTFNSTSRRYWRLVINTDIDQIIIGEVVLGKCIELPQNMNWRFRHSYDYNNLTSKTDYGQSWSYHLNVLRSLEGLNFENIDNDTADMLLDMVDNAKGSHIPLIWFWDDEQIDKSIYGKLADQYRRALNFIDVNSVTGLTIKSLPFAKILKSGV